MSALVILIMMAALGISLAVNFFLMRRKSKTSEDRACTVLLEGIKHVNELMTIRQNFQSIVMYEDSRKLLGMHIPGTYKKFILKYSGEIMAGTDLSTAEITQFVSGNVTITVPRSRILSVNIDMDSIKVYDQRAGIFTSLALDEQNRAIADNLREVGADAESGELKRLSDDNAKNILESLAKGMGIIVSVQFIGEVSEEKAESSLPELVPVQKENYSECV